MTATDQPPRLLLVDDQPANLMVLRESLTKEGYDIFVATSGQAALRIAREEPLDLVLLDVMMPVMDGYDVCRALKAAEATRDVPVIFITAKDQHEALLEGFEAGGVDYIAKPFAREEVLARVGAQIQLVQLRRELARQNEALRQEIEKRRRADARAEQLSAQETARWDVENFVGESPTLRKILDQVRKLQNADSTTVLIGGESGTGKELIARAIHQGSSRADKPLMVVNCSAVPGELAESMLFGHVKGAFTGATADKAGYFELADGGTLFLDEIGDMSPDLQAKLLRVLEDRTVTRLGGSEARQVDVRVVAATHVDLPQRVREGRFRQDLFYRLAAFVIEAPPLRQRREDVPQLVDHFLDLFAAEMGRERPSIRAEALAALQAYHFPGNIRELKNMIEHAMIQSGGEDIRGEHLAFIDVAPPQEPPAPAVVQVEAGAAEEGGEGRVVEFARREGVINNGQCRALLGINRRQASYLLEKMLAAGMLTSEGTGRWTRYRAAE